MSGTLPSYEVLSQRNVTMFTGCDFLCLHVIKNDEAVLVMK